jgi:hypothetical protein
MSSTPRSRRALGVALIPGGLLLAFCCALPAVKGCGGAPIVPYTVPAFCGPYAWGAITAVVFALLLRRPRSARLLAAIDLVAGALLVAFLGVVFHLDSIEQRRIDWEHAPFMAAWWPLAALALLAFLPRREPEWRIGRATWATALVCAAWFASHWREALYGLWVSLGACLVLAVAGFLWERSERQSR